MTDVLGSGLAVTDIGAGGLIVIFVLAIILGRLVPKSTVDDIRAQRDHLMAAREIDQKIIQEQGQQISLLTEGTRLATRVADAIHQAQDAAGGGRNVETQA